MQLGPPSPGRITRLGGGLGCAAAALLVLQSCSVHEDGAGASLPSAPDGSPAVAQQAGAPAGTSRVELRSRVTRVAGHLSDVRRERVARQVRATVEDYLEGAFAGGDHPFEAFLPSLRRQAAGDAAVLRSRGTDGTPRATAWFAVAAPRGRAVGVTARIAVSVPDGGSTSTVTGRLLLTREGSAWRVFGYDLARGEQ